MAVAQKIKASDRQGVCKRLLTSLKKRYSGRLPKHDLPVLETMLFAACLENSTSEAAEVAMERLESEFHDLNEVRVSSVKEAEPVFEGLSHPDWRALRIRSVLQYVFEDTYSFQFEGMKRKTLDSASKQLSKISHMTSFMRLFTLQQCLGSHLLPADDRMTAALIWLGLAEPGTSSAEMSDLLKSAVRKADSQLFCHLMRCLATDPKFTKLFDSIGVSVGDESHDSTTAVERLERLFKRGASAFIKPKKKSAAKTKKHKTPVKKATKAAKSKTSVKTTRKKAGKKTVKVAKPKAVKKKSNAAKTAKKKMVKKVSVKKKPAKKATAKKKSAKKR